MERNALICIHCVANGRRVGTLQIPASTTLSALLDLLAEFAGLPVSFEYLDNEGDCIAVANDGDLREMFELYAWLRRRAPHDTQLGIEIILRPLARGRSKATHGLTIEVGAAPPALQEYSDAPYTQSQVIVSREELDVVGVIGFGHGGTVHKARHRPSGRFVALKSVQLDLTAAAQRQIMKELEIMERCHCPYIVGFHGAFFWEGHFHLAMELMDVGSLESVSHAVGPIPEEILGKLVVAVVRGLAYLYEQLKIVHRDVKPSNMLVNSAGQFKLCDFGVSGQLVDSVAKTFVGTNAYMAPERVLGEPHSVRSDVWSTGMSLVELATGAFPYSRGAQAAESLPSAFELLECIVREPAPVLSAGLFSPGFVDFVAVCLHKEPEKRPTPTALQLHPFFVTSAAQNIDVSTWLTRISQQKHE